MEVVVIMDQVSNKQLHANQVNALKGGVKTAEGKAIVRFNARTHGILANLISSYEGNFYNQILDQLIDEFDPQSAIQTILVERVALYYLRLQRLAKAENEFLKTCIDRTEYQNFFFTDVVKQGFDSVVKPDDISQLHKLYGRYETAIENRLYRALTELRNHTHPHK